uniref:Trafficking protein particle complex subunit 11 n=1 Tax=Clastoptera arizonana TaxID=38151 RepID=A0A1B6BYJ1_9HEMI
MATEDWLEFPSEISLIPLPLVGVAGLDTVNNAIHRNIWEALINSRRQDHPGVHFKLLGPVHEFPPLKPKRNTYEWYIPKGILKRNWMEKHLKELPAVVVIFYDLDWDDPDWPEKKIECKSRVQSIRAALEGRNTRLGVVLIQTKAPLPTGEDLLAGERATTLCTACEINPKCLFVLPHADHLQGYVLRLENAFYELAQSYYQQEIRHVKSHREHLIKTTHQYLFVRHQFKMAFLSELKQDNRTAQMQYSQAYSNLLDLRVIDTHIMELKTVAGFIVYKLCRLLFALSQPRDAISQFRSFIDHFRSKIGPKELAFQHHAWLSKQSNIFGDLFEQAIRTGLPAVQTMHPGYYYEQAARQAVDRKLACLELCQSVTQYPNSDPLVGSDGMEFFGQRPWRAGNLSVQPADPIKEREGILAYQYIEKFKINHSAIIIGLLGNAISQFKTYRCPRMRRHLVIQMADEYYSSKDYGKSLTLLSHMLWDYRNEGWSFLLTNLLNRALCCAYLTASINEYIELALEASGRFSQQHKIRVLENLMSVIQGKVPEPEPGLEEEDIKAANNLWSKVSDPSKTPQTIDMSNFTSCIECKAQFTQAVSNVVEITILIRCKFAKSIQFSRLSVCVNNPSVSNEFAICGDGEAGGPNLLFEPGEVRTFMCQFKPDPKDVGKEIQIGSILLDLGNDNNGGRHVILRFTGNDSDSVTKYPEFEHFRFYPPELLDFMNFTPKVNITLAFPHPLLEINLTHSAPALQGAWQCIMAELTNPDSGPMTQVTLHVAVKPTSEEPTVEQSTEMCEVVSSGLLSVPLSLPLPDIQAEGSIKKQFYLRSHSLLTKSLVVTASYTNHTGDQCAKEVTLDITVEKAMEVTTLFLSTKFESVGKLYAREPFIISPQIDCLSPFPIVIHKTELWLPDEVSKELGEYKCQLSGITLNQGDCGSSVACLVVNQPSEQPLPLGTFVVHWSREDGEVSVMHIPLATVRINSCPLHLELSMPAHGWVRTPLHVAYILHNNTLGLLNVSLNIDPSDAFMFAGHKQIQFRVLPESFQKLEYNLYPLLSGLVALPQIKIAVTPETITQQQISELIDRVVPSHVYIMPQAKVRSTADVSTVKASS